MMDVFPPSIKLSHCITVGDDPLDKLGGVCVIGSVFMSLLSYLHLLTTMASYMTFVR